ncbi:MAG TPA: hypothetical protein VFA99_14580 [Acidobacteriaceae bacterium]|nr:hypothetical protein [Acidobacteriaceae bacterium]
MQEQYFRERQDLQRLLKGSISVLGEELLVIAEEFSEWEDSKRRVDLLALDRSGALVVIELKRTEDGGHMELQAVRYAAMISTMGFQQTVAAHAKFLRGEMASAEAAILDFLGSPEVPESFGQRVRIVLVSPDFSRELTTAVLWLNTNGLDIRCVRVRPYLLDGRTIVEVDQIIPLREAQDYTVRIKEKEQEARKAAESNIDFTRYDLTVGGQTYRNLWKRNLMWIAVSRALQAGLSVEALARIIPSRKFLAVEGELSGEEFLAAAQQARSAEGYVFRPERMFADDEHLIHARGKTVCLSNQWGLPSLPLVDKIAEAVPQLQMKYQQTLGPVDELED